MDFQMNCEVFHLTKSTGIILQIKERKRKIDKHKIAYGTQ